MARKKIKLQWIVNNGARKSTYKKRVASLIKKARELSILCAVDACLIAYSQYHQQPEVWPSPAEVERVVAAFRSRPESDNSKKVINQEMFTSHRLLKAKDEWVKELKKNKKKEIENLKTQCLGGMLLLQGLEQKYLPDLIWAIDDHLEAVEKRIGFVPWLDAAAEVGSRAYSTGTDIPTVGAFTSIDAVSQVGAGDIPAGGAFTSSDVPPLDVPVSLIGGAGDVAVANEAFDDLFDFAIDDQDNQLLHPEQKQNENMGNASGEPLTCDVSDFWLSPYIF